MKGQYEWHAHALIALQEGLDSAVIDDIAKRRLPSFAEPAQAVVYRFCDALLRSGEVGDAAYAAARDLLGEAGLIELIGLIGYYCLISLTLNTFQVPLPDGATPLT